MRQPFPTELGEWLGATPKIAAFFIIGVEDLLIVGICIVLLGRSVRQYFEKDRRLLRTIALIVSVAWFRMILDATAKIIYNPYNPENPVGLGNLQFSNFLFTIIVGILIGVASVLLIYIVNRSAKDFFNKKTEAEEEKSEEALSCVGFF